MARFSFNEADNYSQANRGSFFSLKDDGDVARVRFLYGTLDDISGYAVYKVDVDGKERWVNSLRAYNDPIDKDPFAMAGMRVQAKMFIPVYNVDTDEVQIWERGKNYFATLAGFANRYNPLYNQVFEIERHGKKGDTKTTYQFYPVDSSSFDINSVEIPNPLGTIILDKTYDEMAYYVQNERFPESSQQVAERRQSSQQSSYGQSDIPMRRTPNGPKAF